MKQGNIIQEKSYAFALKVLKAAKKLREKSVERILVNQLIRSGTSIGANVEEAIGAQSDKDFLHKISISYKEARETSYWISLLKDMNDLEGKMADELTNDCIELKRILGAIQKKLKDRLNSNTQ